MKTSLDYMALKKIKPYHNNPRLNEEAVDYVRNSIDTYGFLVPIVLDGANVIITGHTRYLAAKALKLKEVPVIVAKHLPPEKVKGFRLADNKVAEYSTWDESMLVEELNELESMGFNLLETGFSQSEIDCLIEPINADCLDDLNANAVCGDVKTVGVKDKLGVIFGMGGYNVRMNLEDFHEWEKSMIKQFGGGHNIRKEMFKRIGITDFVTKESDAMSLKISIQMGEDKNSKKKVSNTPKKTKFKKPTK